MKANHRLWKFGADDGRTHYPCVATGQRSALEVMDYMCRSLTEQVNLHTCRRLAIREWNVQFSIDALPTIRDRHPDLLRLTELAGRPVVYPEIPAKRSMAMEASGWMECDLITCAGPTDYHWMHWLWVEVAIQFTDDEAGVRPWCEVRYDSKSTSMNYWLPEQDGVYP